MLKRLLAGLTLLLALPAAAQEQQDASPLAVLDIEPDAISVMGVSSGGYMATQLAVAWPERFMGLAVFAAGPWGCARGELSRALTQCMSVRHRLPDLDILQHRYRDYVTRGWVGEPQALAKQRVYIWQGAQDETFDPRLAESLAQQYRHWLDDPAAQLEVEHDQAAGHGWPVMDATASTGKADCTRGGSPYLLPCDNDGAGQALKWLYGDRVTAPRGDGRGMLMRFDQTPFGEDELAEEGYVFVPKTCEEGAPCGLAVALHGCGMSASRIGETFVRHSGLNDWAAENRLVVLYPQVAPSLANPKGCWDWWGYAESSWQRHPAYDSREGLQVQAIMAMIEHLRGTRVVMTE